MTFGDSGDVLSDHEEKWVVCGQVVALYAGTVGDLWDELRETPTKNWKDFRAKVKNLHAAEQERDYEILAYDRRKDRLLLSGPQGDSFVVRTTGSIGAGGAYAVGYLDGMDTPSTLVAAVKLVETAVRIAIKRNSSCGGRIRVLTVSNKPRTAVVIR